MKDFVREISEVIDSEVQDETLRERLKEAIRLRLYGEGSGFIKYGLALRLVEHSWLQKNWRPLVMVMLAGMVVCNYMLVPMLGFTPIVLPKEVFQLMKIGLGVYITGRTVEKIMALKG